MCVGQSQANRTLAWALREQRHSTGYCESFNSKLRDEFLNGEIFYSFKEVQVLAERWWVHYNIIRPHSSLGYRSRAPETWHPEIKTGYGEVESKLRFPPLHTLDGDEISTKLVLSFRLQRVGDYAA
jgi:putative transposase